MTFKIKRNTGIIGVVESFSLIVDGEKSKKIKNDETIEIEIPDKKATIQASQSGIKSNEVIVGNGDKVELVNTFWMKFSRFLLVFIIVILNFMLPDFTSWLIGSILIFGIGYGILYAFPGINYRIQKQAS